MYHVGRLDMFCELRSTDAITNLSVLEDTFLICKYTGNYVELEKLVLILSETDPTFLTQQERTAVAVFEILKKIGKKISIDCLNADHFEYIINRLNRAVNPNSQSKTHNNVIAQRYISLIETYIKDQRELSAIRAMLRSELLSILPHQPLIGRLLIEACINSLLERHFPCSIQSVLNASDDSFVASLQTDLKLINYIEERLDSLAKSKLLQFQSINGLFADYINICDIKRSTSRSPILISTLFMYPIVDNLLVQKVLGVSHTSANKLINDFLEKKIIQPIGHRDTAKKYKCVGVMRLVAT